MDIKFFGFCLLIFVLTALLDSLWAIYIASIAKHQKKLASSTSGMLIIFTAVYTIAYVNDWRYVIPAALGGYVGTYLTMLYREKKGLTK